MLSLYNAACPQNHISLAGLWLAAVARLAALVGPRVSISLRVRDTSALRFLRSLRLRLGGCCHERDERVTNGALHGVLGRAIERDHGLSLGNTAARKSVRHRMFSTPRLCPASAGLFLSSGRQLDACRQHPHPSICDPQPCHLEDPVFLVDALVLAVARPHRTSSIKTSAGMFWDARMASVQTSGWAAIISNAR